MKSFDRRAKSPFLVTLTTLAAAIGCSSGSGSSSPMDASASAHLWTARPSIAAADWRAVWGSGSGDEIFLAGDGDIVGHSADHGQTWTVAATGANGTAGGPDFRDIAGTDGGDVWLAGAIGLGKSVLLHSADHGATWQRRDAGIEGTVEAVWALDASRILVATADGKVCRSTDGGATWAVAYSGAATTLYDVWGGADGGAYAVGKQSGTVFVPDGGSATTDGPGIVLASADGGATWTEAAAQPVGTLWRVWGTPNGNSVYGAGAGVSVAWTTDHASTWHTQGLAFSTPDLDLTNVWVTPDDGSVYFASPHGVVRGINYLTTGPVQFNTEPLPAAAGGAVVPTALWGATGGDVWAVGAGGAIWHRP
jgi:photosystem II stability/assembly factor-like uncharacterized protein